MRKVELLLKLTCADAANEDDCANEVRSLLVEQGYELTSPIVVSFNGKERRERIAVAAMRGILSDPAMGGGYEDFAKESVRYADALIAELDK